MKYSGVNIQESLPFVASDILDEFSFKKVARFLNMVRKPFVPKRCGE